MVQNRITMEKKKKKSTNLVMAVIGGGRKRNTADLSGCSVSRGSILPSLSVIIEPVSSLRKSNAKLTVSTYEKNKK